MAVHDWTLVDAGIFHDFHTVWIAGIRSALNEGLLPEGYYALAEQHAGNAIADILTLHASGTSPQTPGLDSGSKGIAVAEAPPRVRRQGTAQGTLVMRRRSLAIRHVSGHRLVALLEIVSSANKDRPGHLSTFVKKVVAALDADVHVLLVDLFPPGAHDPNGIHAEILRSLVGADEAADPDANPKSEPLRLSSYAAGIDINHYSESLAVGASLPDMPLFLGPDHYINVPLESTYQEAYRGMPAFWRDVLERRTPT